MTLSQHTLRSYDKQLQHLLALILDMGAEVKKLVLAAKASFRSRGEEGVLAAKAADKIINALDRQVEEEVAVVLALQNPMAVDLRFVISVLKITTMLERAGDLAKNTVKRSVKMGEYAPEPIIRKLERMADVTIEMLDGALDAFDQKNTDLATKVWKRDEEIDGLYKEIFDLMQDAMVKNPANAQACTHVVFAAKNIERLADYATNIAKTVYYVASGQRADKAVLKSPPQDEA